MQGVQILERGVIGMDIVSVNSIKLDIDRPERYFRRQPI